MHCFVNASCIHSYPNCASRALSGFSHPTLNSLYQSCPKGIDHAQTWRMALDTSTLISCRHCSSEEIRHSGLIISTKRPFSLLIKPLRLTKRFFRCPSLFIVKRFARFHLISFPFVSGMSDKFCRGYSALEEICIEWILSQLILLSVGIYHNFNPLKWIKLSSCLLHFGCFFPQMPLSEWIDANFNLLLPVLPFYKASKCFPLLFAASTI